MPCQSGSYSFVKRLNDGLVVLDHLEYGEQLWSVSTSNTRTHNRCILGDHDLYGKKAFRPITNKGNRMHRISPEGIKVLESHAQMQSTGQQVIDSLRKLAKKYG